MVLEETIEAGPAPSRRIGLSNFDNAVRVVLGTKRSGGTGTITARSISGTGEREADPDAQQYMDNEKPLDEQAEYVITESTAALTGHFEELGVQVPLQVYKRGGDGSCTFEIHFEEEDHLRTFLATQVDGDLGIGMNGLRAALRAYCDLDSEFSVHLAERVQLSVHYRSYEAIMRSWYAHFRMAEALAGQSCLDALHEQRKAQERSEAAAARAEREKQEEEYKAMMREIEEMMKSGCRGSRARASQPKDYEAMKAQINLMCKQYEREHAEGGPFASFF